MSSAIVSCGKKAFSSLTGYRYTNKDLKKIDDANAASTTLYFGQEPVPGVYSVNEDNKRFLVALKPNGEEDEKRLFTKYRREDYPFYPASADPLTLQNTYITLNNSSPIGLELKRKFANGMLNKSIMEWATDIDIDRRANFAKAKCENAAFNDEQLAPPKVNFGKNYLHNFDKPILTTTTGEQRNSSLNSSIFMDSTFSEENHDNSSVGSSDIDECPPMKCTRRGSFDPDYPSDSDISDSASISGFSFQSGEDELSLSPEWFHDEDPLLKQQGETLSVANFEDDNISMSENSANPSSATSIASPGKQVRFALQVCFKLPAEEKPKEPHTTTFQPKPLNRKEKNKSIPIPNNNEQISAIDLPGYAFLAKPLEITHSALHNRWFLKSELDQRTLYRNMCAAYNCDCEDYCQGMELRRWKLLDDGYSWVPKDEQVLLVKHPLPQAPPTGFWSRFRRIKNKNTARQYTIPSAFRSQLEDSTNDTDEHTNTPNESLYAEHQHLQGVERGDKIGTEGEMLFFLERGEDGTIKMRIMSHEEMAEARELQQERRGNFLVFEGNEDANSGLMKLARYLEKGGEMVTFLCR